MLQERPDNPLMRAGHLEVPCGRCRVCRIERSRQWAVRMMHESQMHEENSFVTLTYDPEHLPEDGSINVRTPQLWLKRLRKYGKISYFLCGEYGSDTLRPHYHCAVFGQSFRQDQVELPASRKGNPQWTNPLLAETWGKGRATAMSLTFESAQYVAKYITAKHLGPSAPSHYQGRTPEFAIMSRNPAVGLRWFDKYHTDVYPRDECVVMGRPGKPPKYYDRLVEQRNPELWAKVKAKRKEVEMQKQRDKSLRRRTARQEFHDYRANRESREI